jgi:hypothetical protein
VKSVLIFVALVVGASTLCYAQNCESLITLEIDEMTGDSSLFMRKPLIISADGKRGIVINIFKSGNTYAIAFAVSGAGSCVDENSIINFLFTDGSRLEEHNNSDFNCDQKSYIYIGALFGKEYLLNVLSNKVIKSLRVWTTDGYVQETLSPDDAGKINDIFSCLYSKKE